MNEPEFYVYKVREVVRVVDGDTIEFMIDYGFKEFGLKKVRVLDLDTYETIRRIRNGVKVSIEETIKGNEAKLHAIKIFETHDVLYIRTKKDQSTLGRYLAQIILRPKSGGERVSYMTLMWEYDRRVDKFGVVAK